MITMLNENIRQLVEDLPVGELTDEELAVRWKLNDPDAYTTLVQRHLDAVQRYVRIRCGNETDSADICQEVFLEVCVKIHNYNPDHSFTSWLYTIARFKTADYFRRLRPSEEYEPARHGEAETSGPSDALERRENAREAWEKVFRMLPETQATAMWMRVQCQMPLAKIAEMLETTEANVKVMLFRARKKLAFEWHLPTRNPIPQS